MHQWHEEIFSTHVEDIAKKCGQGYERVILLQASEKLGPIIITPQNDFLWHSEKTHSF